MTITSLALFPTQVLIASIAVASALKLALTSFDLAVVPDEIVSH